MTTEMAHVPGVEKCELCQVPRNMHGGKMHAFVGAETRNQGLRPNKSGSHASSSDASESQGSLGIALKGDPVLRIALIRKGVLTPEDLTVAEAELKSYGLASAAPTTVG